MNFIWLIRIEYFHWNIFKKEGKKYKINKSIFIDIRVYTFIGNVDRSV